MSPTQCQPSGMNYSPSVGGWKNGKNDFSLYLFDICIVEIKKSEDTKGIIKTINKNNNQITKDKKQHSTKKTKIC